MLHSSTEKKPEETERVYFSERTSIFTKFVLRAASFSAVAFILYIKSLA
jgi:hypothetical protein